jgi:protein involved in polysaccharide export with SLBB domain
MRFSQNLRRLVSASLGATGSWFGAATLLASLALHSTSALAQSAAGSLASRADLTTAAERAEISAITGDPGQRAQNSMIAAAIRQRLRDGDLQVGDRVVVTVTSDAVRRDTAVVKSGPSLELSGIMVVPLAGVLRSELQDRVSAEVLKYVKARQIEVTPLLRVGILGAVVKPGYFAFASDIPLTDAIMGAGGPSVTADVNRSFVRRRNQQYRSASETSKAIAGGLTLDQFGLSAGDEIVIGQRREFGVGSVLAITGAMTTLLALALTLRR